jgi:hypothetical protein
MISGQILDRRSLSFALSEKQKESYAKPLENNRTE